MSDVFPRLGKGRPPRQFAESTKSLSWRRIASSSGGGSKSASTRFQMPLARSGGGQGPRLFPLAVVGSAEDQRLVKRGFIPFQGVIDAKEMATGLNRLDGVEPHFLFRKNQRREHLSEHLRHLDIEDEFFVGGRQSRFQPTGGVENEVCTSQSRSHHVHHRLIARLGVGGVGGTDRGEGQGKPMWRASCPLAYAAFTASGVPKAGAPERMSTFEVKAP